jgi:hypothetical protein
MKKSALDVHIKASEKFNPYVLKDYLTRTEEGVVIVDRSRLLKTKDDERLFYVILNRDYLWNYRYSETATIYFAVEDAKVYGGVYEPGVGCHSKRLIAEISSGHLVHHYIYSAPTLAEICSAINNA